MSALLISRVSTQNQNLDSQTSDITNYTKNNGLHIHNVIELNCSAYKASYRNKIIYTVLHHIRFADRRIKHIIFWSIDRMSRNVLIFLQLVEAINNYDKEILIHFVVENKKIAVNEFFPPTPYACEITHNVINGQMTSSILREKILRYRDVAKKEYKYNANTKLYLGGVIPFGYILNENNRKYLTKDKYCENICNLVSYLKNIKKYKKNDIIHFLNINCIYCPIYINGQRHMFLWDKDNYKKIKTSDNVKKFPTYFNFANFDMNTMIDVIDEIDDNNSDGDNSDSDNNSNDGNNKHNKFNRNIYNHNKNFEVNVLEEKSYKNKKYLVVQWLQPSLCPETINNTCWIPHNYIVN